MTTPEIGTNEHATLITRDRHPGVRAAMLWLAYAHLPEALQSLSAPIYAGAAQLLLRIPTDSAELTNGLNKLIEAKDSIVRAGIRSDYGRAGSVPRPTTVVDPPTGEVKDVEA